VESCLCIRMMTAGHGSPVLAKGWSVFAFLGVVAGRGRVPSVQGVPYPGGVPCRAPQCDLTS
jgi:hypothetical protein